MTFLSDNRAKIRDYITVGGKYGVVDANATGLVYDQGSTTTIAANASSTSITFPTAYSAAPLLFVHNINSAADATATVFRTAASDISATAFVIKANNTATNIVTLNWFAHGLR